MTKKEMTVILVVLKEAYQNFSFTEAKIDLYLELLGDLNSRIVLTAVKKLILESAFVPTISDIRRNVVEVSGPYLPIAAEAWEMVRRIMVHYGQEEGAYELDSLSSLIQKTVNTIGWGHLCLSEDPDISRAHFLKIYDQYREKEMKHRLLPEKLKKEIAELINGDKEEKNIKSLKSP